MHACIHSHTMHAWMHTYTHTPCMHAYTHTPCMHVYIHSHTMHACIHTLTYHACIHTLTYHACMHTYTHIPCMHTYVHTQNFRSWNNICNLQWATKQLYIVAQCTTQGTCINSAGCSTHNMCDKPHIWSTYTAHHTYTALQHDLPSHYRYTPDLIWSEALAARLTCVPWHHGRDVLLCAPAVWTALKADPSLGGGRGGCLRSPMHATCGCTIWEPPRQRGSRIGQVTERVSNPVFPRYSSSSPTLSVFCCESHYCENSCRMYLLCAYLLSALTTVLVLPHGAECECWHAEPLQLATRVTPHYTCTESLRVVCVCALWQTAACFRLPLLCLPG